MKIGDRIQTIHGMSVLHIIKKDPLEFIKYHEIAPDIQILMSITELDSRSKPFQAVPSRFWVGPESWLIENPGWSCKLTEASCHPKAETWPWLARIPHLGSHRGWGYHGMPGLSEVPKWQPTDLTRHRTQLAGHKPWDALPGAVWQSSWRQISGIPKLSNRCGVKWQALIVDFVDSHRAFLLFALSVIFCTTARNFSNVHRFLLLSFRRFELWQVVVKPWNSRHQLSRILLDSFAEQTW